MGNQSSWYNDLDKDYLRYSTSMMLGDLFTIKDQKFDCPESPILTTTLKLQKDYQQTCKRNLIIMLHRNIL